MMQKMYEAGGGRESERKTPILGAHTLKEWVRAEHGVFKLYAKASVKDCVKYSEGNPFGQGLQDGVTLANHNKHFAIAVQCINPRLDNNMCLCIGMVPAKKGADGSGSGTSENIQRNNWL